MTNEAPNDAQADLTVQAWDKCDHGWLWFEACPKCRAEAK